MFKLLLLLLTFTSLVAGDLKSMISNMIIIGFEGEKVPTYLENFIKKNGIGGVILFSKNIKNPQQLKELTASLKALDSSILIATDQEGGLVSRLSKKNGFFTAPKPIDVAKGGEENAKVLYADMAHMLASAGINLNFAPSVDLAKNPKNRVIYKYGRSFSANPNEVIKYANIFISSMQDAGVISVIKHFPGHGSSLGDSHKGFVDVSDSWSDEELKPFFFTKAKALMTAHVYNRHIDKVYPATLSHKTLALLRDRGFDGVIVSDDLQMKAISSNFNTNTMLTKAINASVDLLLFGNQLSKPIMIEDIIKRIEALLNDGSISLKSVKMANKRINSLKKECYARR